MKTSKTGNPSLLRSAADPSQASGVGSPEEIDPRTRLRDLLERAKADCRARGVQYTLQMMSLELWLDAADRLPTRLPTPDASTPAPAEQPNEGLPEKEGPK